MSRPHTVSGSSELWQSTRWRRHCRHSVSLRLRARKPEPLHVKCWSVYIQASPSLLKKHEEVWENTAQVHSCFGWCCKSCFKKDLGNGNMLWFSPGQTQLCNNGTHLSHSSDVIYLTLWSDREPQKRHLHYYHYYIIIIIIIIIIITVTQIKRSRDADSTDKVEKVHS